MKQALNMTQHTPMIAVWILIASLLGGCGGGGDGGGGAGSGPMPTIGVIALPKTGQTTCFDASGGAIACAGTGQDGELQTGVAEPSPRFTAGAGATVDCVTDNLTGLVWVRAPSITPDTWTNALASANGLTLCGFADWRLPNRKELRSLVNHNLANNADSLNTLGFSNVQTGNYWSSSSYAGSADNAWTMFMLTGEPELNAKTSVPSAYVWHVRAGP